MVKPLGGGSEGQTNHHLIKIKMIHTEQGVVVISSVDDANVNFWVLLTSCGSVQSHHWGKLDEGTWDFPVLSLYHSVNL